MNPIEHYRLSPDVQQISPPEGGILSKPVHQDGHVRMVLFGFDQGQELSEHTAAVPALLHIVSGRAKLTLGQDAVEAGPGELVYMQPNLPHSVYALEPLVMALVLLKGKPA